MTAARIGWLGGSFDPVHAGHLHIARGVAEALGLERVLFVPARRPPHKRERRLAPDEDRLALLELACRVDPRFETCDVELRRPGLSYSHDTALQLRAALPPGARLFAIVGADTLADLPNWHRIRELAELVEFCPVRRDGRMPAAGELLAALGQRAVDAIARNTVTLPEHPASSTAVREQLQRGELSDWLPPGVGAEIRRRGLYGFGGGSSSDSSGSSRSAPDT